MVEAERVGFDILKMTGFKHVVCLVSFGKPLSNQVEKSLLAYIGPSLKFM